MMRTNYLMHHGILGQRWGVRRFQNKDGSYTSAGKDRYSVKGSREKADSEDSSKRKGLSDKQKDILKKVAIGTAIVTGTVLAAYGTYKLYDSGIINKALDKFVKDGQNSTVEILGNNDDGNVNQVTEKFVLKRNSNFKLTEDNIQSCCADVNPDKSRKNCGACSIASFLKMLGYEDVYANGEIPEKLCSTDAKGNVLSGLDQQKIKDIFQGAEIKDLATITNTDYPRTDKGAKRACERMTKELLKFGEGASGLLWTEHQRKEKNENGEWIYGPGHYCSWRILNGKLHILEGQPVKEGIVWTDFYEGCGRIFDPGALGFVRLDGLKINEEALQGLLRNKK